MPLFLQVYCCGCNTEGQCGVGGIVVDGETQPAVIESFTKVCSYHQAVPGCGYDETRVQERKGTGLEARTLPHVVYKACPLKSTSRLHHMFWKMSLHNPISSHSMLAAAKSHHFLRIALRKHPLSSIRTFSAVPRPSLYVAAGCAS